MKIGNNNNIAVLHLMINSLQSTFTKVMLVNPIEQEEILVYEYKLEDSLKKCTASCPLRNDKCGCICKDTISTESNRCRFVYNKTEAYFVASTLIKMKYRDYTLVLIMKLDPSFSFGTFDETEAIDNITKISSNLIIDPLTGIFNRKYIMENIDYLIQKSLKENKYLCLACIDIDNFKKFNDTYGHDFGDKVLQSVANNMVKSTAVLNESYNVRIGGDEFVIVAVGVDKQRFKAIMNKLCMQVDDTKLQYEKEFVSVKISIGVGELFSDKVNNYKDLYDVADRQLYKAKEAGKGCVR